MPNAVKRVFDDLLNIEVNTMLRSGMTGRKMPATGHALLDIHGGYESWLNAYSVELNEGWSGFRVSADAEAFRAETVAAGDGDRWWVIDDEQFVAHLMIEPPLEGEVNGIELFDGTRWRARIAEDVHRLLDGRRGYTVRDGGDVLLKRIVGNSDQLKAILERAASGQPPMLTRATATGFTNVDVDSIPRDDLITIRKAWEMGTEVIAMQTVVQLDGDIVTRLNSAYAAERYQPVRDLHRESVGSALEHWRYLVETLVTMAKSVVSGLT